MRPKNIFAPYAYWPVAGQKPVLRPFEPIKIGVKSFLANGFMRVTGRKHCKNRGFCEVEQIPFGKI